MTIKDKDIARRIAIGKRVRSLRERRGFSVTMLSQMCGMKGHSSISNIETGANNLTIPFLYRLRSALDCKVTDILPAR